VFIDVISVISDKVSLPGFSVNLMKRTKILSLNRQLSILHLY